MSAPIHHGHAAQAEAPHTQSPTQRLYLIVAILAAFLLGCLRLGAQSLWYDEGVTAMVAQKAPFDLIRWTAADIQPPLYYIAVSAFSRLVGWSEWALRFPSVLAGTAAVSLIARLAADLGSAGRRGRGAIEVSPSVFPDSTPVWAAWILALHPFAVYYTQEARMYALLLALCTAAGVALAPALSRTIGVRRWIAYGLLGVAALYTHYFASLVLLAFAIAWLWPVRSALTEDRQSDRRHFLWVHGAMALFFAPWAVVMLRRLGDDASYWQGRLKLGEALGNTAGRLIAGETVPERTALLMGVILLALTCASVVHMWRAAPARRVELRFALLWLLVPTVAVLALAAFAPKFNVRYIFPALPGLVLLWALTAATFVGRAQTGENKSPGAVRWTARASLVALAAIFVWSGLNWYTQPRYAKAQWRELTEFLRPRLTADENVILVSGHAWPVWEFYAPDIPIVRLPALDVLDVNEVLDFASTAAPLREVLQERPGAWLVNWQDEVVDPNEVVPVQLELGGREKGSSARFNQLSLRRWSNVRDFRIADEPPITVPVDAQFGDNVRLAGYHALDNGDLLLFWQAGPEMDGRDLHFALEVSGADRIPVASVDGRRLAGYNDPTFRWAPEAIVMGRIPATAWLGGSPQPGDYSLKLRVYDGNDPAAAPLVINGAEELRIDGVTAVIE